MCAGTSFPVSASYQKWDFSSIFSPVFVFQRYGVPSFVRTINPQFDNTPFNRSRVVGVFHPARLNSTLPSLFLQAILLPCKYMEPQETSVLELEYLPSTKNAAAASCVIFRIKKRIIGNRKQVRTLRTGMRFQTGFGMIPSIHNLESPGKFSA